MQENRSRRTAPMRRTFLGATGHYTTRGCAAATGISDTGVVSITLRYRDVGTISY